MNMVTPSMSQPSRLTGRRATSIPTAGLYSTATSHIS
jgi:hypothetical protein